MTWVDQSSLFGFGAVLTSTQIQNLRDNLTSMTEGDVNAPQLTFKALQRKHGRTLIKDVTFASSRGEIEFVGDFNSSYDLYEVELRDTHAGSSSASGFFVVALQVSADSGATYVGSANYNNTNSSATYGHVVCESENGGSAHEMVKIRLSNALADTTAYKLVRSDAVSVRNNGTLVSNYNGVSGVVNVSGGTYNTVKFICTSQGNFGASRHWFEKGNAYLYGITTNSY